MGLNYDGKRMKLAGIDASKPLLLWAENIAELTTLHDHRYRYFECHYSDHSTRIVL